MQLLYLAYKFLYDSLKKNIKLSRKGKIELHASVNSNGGRNISRRKCCGKYHEEEFKSKGFALLSKKDFQEKPQTREGPQTLQFARLQHS